MKNNDNKKSDLYMEKESIKQLKNIYDTVNSDPYYKDKMPSDLMKATKKTINEYLKKKNQ